MFKEKTYTMTFIVAFYFIMHIGCIGVSNFCFQRRKLPYDAREQINDRSKNERGSWDAYKLVREGRGRVERGSLK